MASTRTAGAIVLGALAIGIAAAMPAAVGAQGKTAGDWRTQTHTKSRTSPGVAANRLAQLYSGRVAKQAAALKADAANDLTGAWVVVVQPPAPAPAIRSFQVFNEGGTWVEVSNEPQATRSPMIGAWERINGRLYAATGIHHRFDPQTGASVGWWKIDRTMELSPDGQSCAVVARVTMYNTAGNVLGSFMVSATATRLAVDGIPEQS
jgi:hypothetical protein